MNYPSFSGIVIHGNHIGRTLGFPTANIATSDTIPLKGVYIAHITLKDKTYYGLLNIGTRPTLHLTQISIEVYIFDFSKDIYNQKMQITPLHFIRTEMKFNTLNELKKEMEKDEMFAREWIYEKGLR